MDVCVYSSELSKLYNILYFSSKHCVFVTLELKLMTSRCVYRC